MDLKTMHGLLTRAEAEQLAGGPLGEATCHESEADDSNGGDHTMICAYFPEGYDMDTAEAPPERGVQVTLHAMPTAAAATAFYTRIAAMTPMMIEQIVGPDAKVTPVAGVGEKACLAPMGNPAAPFSVANLSFVQGDLFASIQAWKKDAAADGAALGAARQVASRLP